MKFPIFLCLLPFTLSVIPPLQKSKNFIFNIPPLRPSLNIWGISGKSSVLEPARIEFQKDLQLNSFLTYIILEVQEPNNEKWICRAFYWIGKQTLLVERQMIARLIPKMMYELSEQLHNNLHLIHLSRENQHQESFQFRSLFQMDYYETTYLYKVTGSMGQYIIEVPWRYSELNGTDTFIFHKDVFVYVWNADPIHNEYKQEKAIALAYRISKVDRDQLYTSLKIGDESSPLFQTFKERFFKFMKDVPLSLNFPKHPSMISDNEIQNKRNKDLQLFEYSWENDIIIHTEIFSRPLELNNFKTDKTYIMLDHNVGNAFLFIGKHADLKMIEVTMSDAEVNYSTMYIKGKSGPWRKLTVVREGYTLPAHFIVNFPKSVKFLGYYPAHRMEIV